MQDKHVHDTWYRLADGTLADPNDVTTDKDGVMCGKNGVPVALRESGVPMTVGVETATSKNVDAAEAGKKKPGEVPVDGAGESTDGALVDGDPAPESPDGKYYKNRKMKSV